VQARAAAWLTALAAAGAVAALAASRGGYYPEDWGLPLLAAALAALALLAVTPLVELGRRGLLVAGCLGALAVWAGVSALWSTGAERPVLEAERGLLYAVSALALALALRRPLVLPLLVGIAAGVTAVAVYALGTRLLPGTLGGAYDPSSGYQLGDPIGYWNALGILVAVGALLALGIGLRGPVALRPAAGAVLVPLAATLYFTFSRGSLLAACIGAVVLVCLERRPAGALAGGVVLALAPGLGVLAASRLDALTAPGATLQTAQSQGHRLLWQLAALTACGALAGLAATALDRRVSGRVALPRPPRAALVAVAVLAVAGLGLAGTAVGGRALDAFEGETVAGGDLNGRLLSAAGNGRGDYWRVAATMALDRPVLGAGAASFEQIWLRERPTPVEARDAHSLYLETLAELGPVGLALLGVALAVPLAALRRRGEHPLLPAAAGAYAAFLLHAGLDWDWEVPVVALPALACGLAVVAAADGTARLRLDPRARGGVALLLVAAAGVAAVAHVGNRALARAETALVADDPAAATAAARQARAWLPWAASPPRLAGEVALARGRDGEARRQLADALALDGSDWRTWFDLAVVESGARSAAAFRRAARLNPLSPEIAETREALHTDP
jgi:O-antigen ligase/polysaccharide polymerase Wzy-like membrane protein